jgi:hypothetical protein
MEAYEEQLAAFSRCRQGLGDTHQRNCTSLPLRATCISEGENRIEISEFTTEKLEPLVSSHVAWTGFFDRRRADERPMSPRSLQPSINPVYGFIDSVENGAFKSPVSSIFTQASGAQRKPPQSVLLLPS